MSASTLRLLLNDPTPDLKKINGSISRFMKRPKLQKSFFKVMLKIWSEDDDSRRILSLINILKALTVSPACCGLCYKLMYAVYIRNCKFVAGSTLAHINFMRLSLMEVFSVDLDEAYLHAFAYIRQLAIGMRKAYTTRSKADSQSIMSWPFVNGLRLWVEFVAKYLSHHKLIAGLVHPLVQLLVGLTKLNGGERWIPLRFHCISMLHTLAGVPTLPSQSDSAESSKTCRLIGRSLTTSARILVPSLPLLLDTFQLVNFNRRSFGASKAPLDLRLMLHFSPSQLKETASLDAVVSWLCDLLAESAATHMNSLAFPEYALPLINELKQFCSTCRVSSFTRQMKALLTKLREHSDWVSTRQRQLRNLANAEELVQIESKLAGADESPFLNFYILHKEVRAKELAHLTECHQKNPVLASEPDAPRSEHLKDDQDVSESDSEADSDASDESYDLDDGSTLTHVSKSKPADESDSDFDLEAALNESDHEEAAEDQLLVRDELSDFALSESETEIEPEGSDAVENTGKGAYVGHRKRKRTTLSKKMPKNLRTKKRKANTTI